MILKAQNDGALLKAINRLCNQEGCVSTGLTEIINLERSLALNVQGRCSKLKYMRLFKAAA